MSTAAVMEKELAVVSANFQKTVSRLERRVPSHKRHEFDSEKQEVLAAIAESRKLVDAIKVTETPITQLMDVPPLFDRVNKLGSASYTNLNELDKQLLLSTRNESERFYRTEQLLRASSEDEYLKALWWVSQRGLSQDLDLLYSLKTSHRATSAILPTLVWAEQEILKREKAELMEFFRIDAAQFLDIITVVIRASKDVRYQSEISLRPRVCPSQVIKQIQEIKQLLERLLRVDKIERWLTTPQEQFGHKTLRDELFAGNTQFVIEALKKSSLGFARTDSHRRFAVIVFVVTSLFVVIGLIPLRGTVMGFGMAFGGALLAYESLLLIRALRAPLQQRGR